MYSAISPDSVIVQETIDLYRRRKEKTGSTNMRECALIKAKFYKVNVSELLSAVGRRNKGMKHRHKKKGKISDIL